MKLGSLHRTTKGSDIFGVLQEAAAGFGYFKKLLVVVTDEAPAMHGSRV